ncbi:hypothetical protein GWK47_036474 [Chionoecetes opilio]|uniref:Uncharacterized protein n=1 Tax=Chionoecetes opilio TaxID=41210 RepID=A0A8J4YFQ9_CHIOP|nr:hypothetical protein GWK47_036474 [Chionoecetes opilio]
MPQQHTTLDQVKFMSEWFMSWSEMQREDFLPVLMQAYQPKDHLNGLVGGYESLSSQGRRPSLFDCQMKLFQDWFGSWTETEQQSLLEQLQEVDPEFMVQYDKKLRADPSQEEATQPECGVDDVHNPPSSLSSPPSTLPRSHSPHDSGLDEPSTDNEHAEPQSLDSSRDKEDTAPAGQSLMDDASTPSSAVKAATNVNTVRSDAQGEEAFNMDDLANGLAESQNTAGPGTEETTSPAACEAVAEH